MSPFSARLCRAHANCYESLAVVAAVVLLALQSGQGALIHTAAPWLLAARIGQSAVHLMSTNVPMVCLRFTLQWVQVGILFWWCLRLLQGGMA